MDATTVRRLVEQQLAAGGSLTNMHGITVSNLRSRLVVPFEAIVDPDDLETAPRPVWVVLQERDSPYEGYVVVNDPATAHWGVAELSNTAGSKNMLVVSASSLTGALDGM